MGKVHFVSLGCPKNLVDSEIMLASLLKEGYALSEDPQEADTIIVNTCGFIEDAKRESISKILEMAQLKKQGQLKNLVVAGCLTQRYKDELVEGLPEADFFIGSGEFHKISRILKDGQRKDHFHQPTYLQTEDTPRVNSQPSHRAYLKLSEGCKKRCSFCAIPLIRGSLQSRSIEAIVSEAQLLVAGGVKELILVSHDFTDYGWDRRRRQSNCKDTPLNLLKALSEESGASWIRVMYLYPDGVNSEMVNLFKERENLLNYFDMPFQHINDDILKRMNRRMTRFQIQKAIELIREEISDAVIRTQFIVGFPGETEKQFQELLKFIEWAQLDRVGCFKYSQEEGTKAARLDGQVPDEVKEERFQQVMALQREISRKKQSEWVGKAVEVLVEGVSEESEHLLQGRTPYQAPDIDGVTYINDGYANRGDIVTVQITQSHDYDLVGFIQSPEN